MSRASGSMSSNTSPGDNPGKGSGSGASGKRRKVSRTRTGCLACRKRRKLCDMGKPVCEACTRLKLVCEWPQNLPGEASRKIPVLHNKLPPLRDTTMTDFIDIFGQNQSRSQQLQPQTQTLPAPLPSLEMPFRSLTPPGAGAGDFSGFFPDGFNLDEATLQLWAADCLSMPSAPMGNPLDSLSNLLFNQPSRQVDSEHAPLLNHYQKTLTNFVSSGDPNTPDGFDAFLLLANASASTPPGQALHLCTLAWAGRHMVNKGQIKYESLSERLGIQASETILEQVRLWKSLGMQGSDAERMTLLAGTLMLVQFKVSRGDVWGFAELIDNLRDLASTLYTTGPCPPVKSAPFSFFENLAYHDVLSSSILLKPPILPSEVVHAYVAASTTGAITLSSLLMPMEGLLHRLADLVKMRRNDSDLELIIAKSDLLLADLHNEKVRVDGISSAVASYAIFGELHDSFRIACILAIHNFVLYEAPVSITCRHLVKKILQIVEHLSDSSDPILFAAAHWVLFVAGLCSIPGHVKSGEMDDRARVERLYEDSMNEQGFLNTSRSWKVVQEVWERNDGGRIHIDWLDVVLDFDWELFLV